MLVSSPILTQVAKKIHEFAAQASQNELVFPATLGSAERHAAHRIAAAKGLRHESRGDTDRSLHIRKVRFFPNAQMNSTEHATVALDSKARLARQLMSYIPVLRMAFANMQSLKPKDEQEVAEIVAAEAAREEERAQAANDRSKVRASSLTSNGVWFRFRPK